MRSSFSKFLLLWVLSIGLVMSVFRVQPVSGFYTIYIRSDGSVDPSSVPIRRAGYIYTFTDSISDSIVVEMDDIILDGQGHSLQGDMSYSTGVDLYAENITVRNLTITQFVRGINLHDTNNHTISGNQIIDNQRGIEGDSSSGNNIYGNNLTGNHAGIFLVSTSHNKIFGNDATNNRRGMFLFYISNSNIFGNNLTANEEAGIIFARSLGYNQISGNRFVRDGLSIMPSPNDLVFDNWVNGRPLVYLYGESGYVIEEAGQVLLYECNNIIVKNLNLSETIGSIGLSRTNNSEISGNYITTYHGDGIGIGEAFNNSIHGNHIESNTDGLAGIFLYESANNTMYGNTITNYWDGLWFLASSNNSIYENNIINNVNGIYISEWTNPNGTYTKSVNNLFFHNNLINNNRQVNIQTVFGNSSIGFWDDAGKGNYWGDYYDKYPNASEIDDTGVWDTPYIIDEYHRDNYPLMKPVNPLFCDMNFDFKIDMRDIGVAAWAFGSYPTHPRWNNQADLNQDDRLDMKDLVIIARNFGETDP